MATLTAAAIFTGVSIYKGYKWYYPDEQKPKRWPSVPPIEARNITYSSIDDPTGPQSIHEQINREAMAAYKAMFDATDGISLLD